MNKGKEFSTLKWIVFPAISLVLSGAIAYFNLRVFGYEDGLPYAVIVLMIGIFSIIINAYTESQNRKLAIAAFVFEIFLAGALIGNAAYSLSVQRKMAVARMGETQQTKTIEEISKLKGARNQRKALSMVSSKDQTSQSAQAAFGQYEDILFWIMVTELALFGVCAFTLFGIAKLIDSPQLTEREKEIQRRVLATRTPYRVRSDEEINSEYDRQAAIYDAERGHFEEQKIIRPRYVGERTFKHNPDGSRTLIESTYSEDQDELTPEEGEEREHWRVIADRRREYWDQLRAKFGEKPLNSLPSNVVYTNGLEDENAEKRTPASRADFTTRPLSQTEKKDTRKTHVSFDFVHYAEGLRALRECLKEISFYHPGISFKADLKPDGVWIRAMRAVEGTQETTHSVKGSLTVLDDAVRMKKEAFRQRLEKFLRDRGFSFDSKGE